MTFEALSCPFSSLPLQEVSRRKLTTYYQVYFSDTFLAQLQDDPCDIFSRTFQGPKVYLNAPVDCSRQACCYFLQPQKNVEESSTVTKKTTWTQYNSYVQMEMNESMEMTEKSLSKLHKARSESHAILLLPGCSFHCEHFKENTNSFISLENCLNFLYVTY